MTSRPDALDPTPYAGRRWAPALVSALLLSTVVACGTDSGDDDPSASDPTASTSSSATSSTSESPSASDSASASPSPTENGDPVPSPVIDKAVKGALKDDFPALVPAGVPAGWTVVSATYSAADDVWRIELTDPSGAPVRLVQNKSGVKTLVKQELGASATAGDEVDLGEYGTGVWTVYTADSGTAIAKKLSGTSALVVGADQDTVVELAELLLTAEDAGAGTGDG